MDLEIEFKKHQAVSEERWLEILNRIKRLEMIMITSAGAIILFLLAMVID
jgi:hypothetical protein|tara:strand:- start:724 stop:873 length:150 start_codon:yes stop_codon:yes gene_type:complete